LTRDNDAFEWIRSPHGEVCTQGAHVTRWTRGPTDLLFLSAKSRFERGQAIRGGVPVVFPWFGDDPEARGRPAHGFARRMPWRVLAREDGRDALRVVLELVDDEGTRALWPGRFALRLEVVLAETLALGLRVENRGASAFRCEPLLHPYFAVGDVRQIEVHGLERALYLDKPDGFREKRALDGPLRFAGEVDRIHLGHEATCTIADPVLGRRLEVSKTGARSTVVWNPWVEKAQRYADLGEDEWSRFVCVEPGNVGPDALVLEPGEAHELGMRVAVVEQGAS
jgi:glucose-6-phosphate 1-epimerase